MIKNPKKGMLIRHKDALGEEFSDERISYVTTCGFIVTLVVDGYDIHSYDGYHVGDPADYIVVED